jgi:leader peptidase (prepilin peptidase) / N-methyltransferase
MIYILIIITGIAVGYMVGIYIELSKGTYFKTSLKSWYSKKIYLITSVILALVYLAIFIKYGYSMNFFVYSVLGIILAAASLHDLDNKIIPDRLFVAGIILGILSGFDGKFSHTLESVLSFLAAGGILWMVSFITKDGIGMGDIKLYACAGIFLGFQMTLSALLLSTLLSGITGMLLLATRVLNRKSSIPFAPFIFAGCMLVIVL